MPTNVSPLSMIKNEIFLLFFIPRYRSLQWKPHDDCLAAKSCEDPVKIKEGIHLKSFPESSPILCSLYYRTNVSQYPPFFLDGEIPWYFHDVGDEWISLPKEAGEVLHCDGGYFTVCIISISNGIKVE